jgi:hypothetical protein
MIDKIKQFIVEDNHPTAIIFDPIFDQVLTVYESKYNKKDYDAYILLYDVNGALLVVIANNKGVGTIKQYNMFSILQLIRNSDINKILNA